MGAERVAAFLEEVEIEIDLDGDQTVLHLMDDLGWAEAGPAGPIPVSWKELDAFADRHAHPMDQHTLEHLHHLSRMWCHGYERGKAEPFPPTMWEEFEDVFLNAEEGW